MHEGAAHPWDVVVERVRTTHPTVRKRDLLGAAPLLAAAFALGPSGSARAADNAAETIANKRRITAAFAAWMNGTGSIAPLLADDIVWTIAGHALVSGTTAGKTALTDDILTPFAARFAKSGEPFRPTAIAGIYADGPVIVVRWDGRGVANDGKPYSNSYAWFLTIREGFISEATAFFDTIAFNEFWTRVQP